MEQKTYSEHVSDFLNFIRDAQQQYSMALATEAETNAATQDILHSIELEEHSYNEMAKLGRKLADVRKERRKAKDVLFAATPVVEWAEANAPVIKAIERLLGDIRKEERRTENRIFTPKTNAVEESKAPKKTKKK